MRWSALLLNCVLSVIFMLMFFGCSMEQEPTYNRMGISKHIERYVTTENERTIEKSLTAIVEVGEGSVPYILDAWKDYESVEARCRLASAIDYIGPPAAPLVPFLLEELNEVDERRISCAAMALGGIGPASAPATEILGNLLRSTDYSTQANLLYALGGIGPAASSQIPLMLEAADREQTSSIAISALGNMGEAAVEAVLPWLEDGDDAHRLRACQILSRMQGEDLVLVLTPLSIALRDDNPKVRIEAVKALGAARTSAIPVYPSIVYALRDTDDEVREEIVQALISIGPIGGKELINALTDKYWRSREGAARVIGTFSSLAETAKSTLILRLDDSKVEVRLAVIRALSTLGPEVVDEMIQQLKSGSVYRRFGGARVLGEIGPPAAAAIPELQKLLNDKDVLIRSEAKNAIRSIVGDR
ncbi:MAG TPA: HEAT repeat domain-containing protein [Bacteroidetes bacterium]|nr:HEAT repeat protein [bacterium BMS3Bbin04]HDO64992.1 HEAT repeat domain-containing protein [Bacteroidota bacterium]HEX04117.1 HEAT repeat domain-containing protein [Bacteroidota bacterium]